MRHFTCGVLLALGLSFPSVVRATTVFVDPATADGVTTFVSLNTAGRYLVNNALDRDGQPDEIRVMVDTLDTVPSGQTEGGFAYSGNDDLTIEGDGNNNGVWCRLTAQTSCTFNGVVNSQTALFLFTHEDATAWNASIVLRNLILIPQFQSAGTAISGSNVVIRPLAYDMGNHVSTGGSILVENLIVTGSLSDGSAADPFTNSSALVTRFQRGIISDTGNGAVAVSATKLSTQFRNVVLSMIRMQALNFIGRNEHARFGPGFVLMYVTEDDPVVFSSSALGSIIDFVGAPDNRNLIYGFSNPTPATAASRTVIAASGPTTSQLNVAYTDLIKNVGTRQIRMDMPISIDNMVMAEMTYANGGEGHLELFEAGLPSVNITNSTFFNAGSTGTNNRHFATRVPDPVVVQNCIFAAADGEADGVTSTTCDRAVAAMAGVTPNITSAYCLYPESGLNKLRKPVDGVFPPSPATDSGAFACAVNFDTGNQNVDPQFLSTNVADYPLPANLAAWAGNKIALTQSGYLRPTNAALLSAGPSGINLHGAWTTHNVPVELSAFATE